MVTYADHDVQHIVHEVRFLDTADSGPTDALESVEQFEVTERGLDPDELAELRAMRVQYAIRLKAQGDQGNAGSVEGLLDAGYNLSGTEFLNKNETTENVDADNSGTDDFTVFTRDTDEVGQVYTAHLSAGIPFDDNTNGDGGSANMGNGSDVINWNDLTGGGPIVDSADDFVSRIALNVTDCVTEVGFRTLYSLYYAVEESESGRTRFGR